MGGSTQNGHTFTKSPRALSPSPTCPIPLSLYSYFISSIVLCYYVFIPQFHFTLPRGFSLAPSHIARIYLMALSLFYYSAWFPPTTTHEHLVLFHLHLCPPSPVLLALQPHPPTHTITVFTTQYSPFPSQAHIPPHLFPRSPLPHQPPIPYINCTGISIPVINNEYVLERHFGSSLVCRDDETAKSKLWLRTRRTVDATSLKWGIASYESLKNTLTSKVPCNWHLENIRLVWSISQVILVSSCVYFAKLLRPTIVLNCGLRYRFRTYASF